MSVRVCVCLFEANKASPNGTGWAVAGKMLGETVPVDPLASMMFFFFVCLPWLVLFL